MRESRTYGSVRGGYRKVPVYSIVVVMGRNANSGIQHEGGQSNE